MTTVNVLWTEEGSYEQCHKRSGKEVKLTFVNSCAYCCSWHKFDLSKASIVQKNV